MPFLQKSSGCRNLELEAHYIINFARILWIPLGQVSPQTQKGNIKNSLDQQATTTIKIRVSERRLCDMTTTVCNCHLTVLSIRALWSVLVRHWSSWELSHAVIEEHYKLKVNQIWRLFTSRGAIGVRWAIISRTHYWRLMNRFSLHERW